MLIEEKLIDWPQTVHAKGVMFGIIRKTVIPCKKLMENFIEDLHIKVDLRLEKERNKLYGIYKKRFSNCRTN